MYESLAHHLIWHY